MLSVPMPVSRGAAFETVGDGGSTGLAGVVEDVADKLRGGLEPGDVPVSAAGSDEGTTEAEERRLGDATAGTGMVVAAAAVAVGGVIVVDADAMAIGRRWWLWRRREKSTGGNVWRELGIGMARQHMEYFVRVLLDSFTSGTSEVLDSPPPSSSWPTALRLLKKGIMSAGEQALLLP
jgi:hypothetical protein